MRRIFRRKNRKTGQFSWLKCLGRICRSILIWMLILLTLTVIFFDQLLYFSIITIGSRLAGVEITMDNVETSLSRGDIKIINLRIGNPEGFGDELLMEVSSVYLAVDKSSLFSDEVIIRNLELRNLSAYGEINQHGMLNMQKLADNLRQYCDERQETSGKRIIFNSIRLDNISVQIRDHKQKRNINGTGIALKKAIFSPMQGNAELNYLQITPPGKYSGKLLEVDSVKLRFTPDVFHAEAPEISDIAVDGLRANVGLQGMTSSSIHEIFWNCHQLFFAAPDSQPDTEAENTGEMDSVICPVDRFCFRNVSLKFNDTSKISSIHGFGVSFDELCGSLKSGKLQLTGLQVDNPNGFDQNMLKIKSANFDFAPESIFSVAPEITAISADTILAGVGFREDNQSNLYTVYHSLTSFFRPFSAFYDDAENEEEFLPLIGRFDLSNIDLSVWDRRKENNINGFGISVKNFNGSVRDGELSLTNLQVNPPAGYSHEMLAVKSLALKFIPESLMENEVIINDIQVEGLSATAGLKDHNHSNFQEVADTVEILISSLAAASAPEPIPQTEDQESVITVKNCLLKNCSISVFDTRKSGNIQGFAIHIGEFSYNSESGWLWLRKLRIANPSSYSRPNLLHASEISAKMPKTGNRYQLRNIAINDLHASLEYKKSGKTNFHEVADALFVVFEQPIPCNITDTSKKPASQEKEGTTTLEYYKISNSSMSIWDAKRRIPLKVPLEFYQKAYQMSDDDTPILESIHEEAVELEQELRGVTDANNVLMQFFNSTAKSGIDFLIKSGSYGTDFLQSLFNLL